MGKSRLGRGADLLLAQAGLVQRTADLAGAPAAAARRRGASRPGRPHSGRSGCRRAGFVCERFELGIQVRLAEVAAVYRVAGVALVIDFSGVHELVAQAKLLCELECIFEF